jgi:hypothetical protein
VSILVIVDYLAKTVADRWVILRAGEGIDDEQVAFWTFHSNVHFIV